MIWLFTVRAVRLVRHHGSRIPGKQIRCAVDECADVTWSALNLASRTERT